MSSNRGSLFAFSEGGAHCEEGGGVRVGGRPFKVAKDKERRRKGGSLVTCYAVARLNCRVWTGLRERERGRNM